MRLLNKTHALFTVKSTLAALGWRRGDRFFCPVCARRYGKLEPFVGHYSIRGALLNHYTPNSLCPVCRSDMRHRFMMTVLQGKIDAGQFAGSVSVLHFAPEPGIYRALRSRLHGTYIAADLNVDGYRFAADARRIDITGISFPEGSFDLILCSHVLEHIEDDELACAEIFRDLKPGGTALIALPTYGESTLELPDLDEAGRVSQYGDPTHRRLNGLDFSEKLQRVGFRVSVLSIDDVQGDYVDRSAQSPHMDSDRYLFVCEKQ